MKRFFSMFMLIFAASLIMVGCSVPKDEETVPVYNMATYTVYHYYQGVDGYYSSSNRDVEQFSERVGVIKEAPLPRQEEFYNFDQSKSSGYSQIIKADNSIVFQLYYSRKIYTIYLIDSYKSESQQFPRRHGVTITLPTKQDETKTFVGWAYDEQGENLATDLTIMPTNNLNLYAVWKD